MYHYVTTQALPLFDNIVNLKRLTFGCQFQYVKSILLSFSIYLGWDKRLPTLLTTLVSGVLQVTYTRTPGDGKTWGFRKKCPNVCQDTMLNDWEMNFNIIFPFAWNLHRQQHFIIYHFEVEYVSIHITNKSMLYYLPSSMYRLSLLIK